MTDSFSRRPRKTINYKEQSDDEGHLAEVKSSRKKRVALIDLPPNPTRPVYGIVNKKRVFESSDDYYDAALDRDDEEDLVWDSPEKKKKGGSTKKRTNKAAATKKAYLNESSGMPRDARSPFSNAASHLNSPAKAAATKKEYVNESSGMPRDARSPFSNATSHLNSPAKGEADFKESARETPRERPKKSSSKQVGTPTQRFKSDKSTTLTAASFQEESRGSKTDPNKNVVQRLSTQVTRVGAPQLIETIQQTSSSSGNEASLKVIHLSCSTKVSQRHVSLWKNSATVETFSDKQIGDLAIRRETVDGKAMEGVDLNFDVAEINDPLYGVGCGILESLFQFGGSLPNRMIDTVRRVRDNVRVSYFKTIGFRAFVDGSNTFLERMNTELAKVGLVICRIQGYPGAESSTDDHGDGRSNDNMLMTKIGGWFKMKVSQSKKEPSFLRLLDGNAVVVNPSHSFDDVRKNGNNIVHAGGGPYALTLMVATDDGRVTTKNDQLNICRVLYTLNQGRAQGGVAHDRESFEAFFDKVQMKELSQWATEDLACDSFFMDNVNVLRTYQSKHPEFDINSFSAFHEILKGVLVNQNKRTELGRWQEYVRRAARNGTLDEWKTEILAGMGLKLDKRENVGYRHHSSDDVEQDPTFRALKNFREGGGDLHELSNNSKLPHPDGGGVMMEAGKLLKQKKSDYRRNSVSQAWIDGLTSLGFDFAYDKKDPRNHVMYKVLAEYIRQNDSLDVDTCCSTLFTLPNPDGGKELKVGWFYAQKKNVLKEGRLSQKWCQALRDFGFSWAQDVVNDE
jgi:hypothetical protein